MEQVELDFDSIGADAENREELLTECREWQSLSVLPAQKLVTAVDRVRAQVEATRQHRDSEIKGQQAFSSSCIVGTVAVRDPAATAVNDVGGNCCCYVPIAAADAGGNVVHVSHPRCD